jgi:hypothetical protein
MSDHEAPWVFVTYAHDSPAHKEQVRQFAHFLRARIGLDVRLDQWDDNKRIDWSRWAVDHLTKADFIVVIASPDYKRRADGHALPHEGRGSQFEAAIIRNHLTKNLHEETERVLPVVLPGGSVEDIPEFLNPYSTTRFEIDELSEAGVSGLLSAITGQGEYPLPERGQWRGGTRGDPASSRVLLAKGVDWLDSSPHVRAGGAWIGGVHYEDSIVLRPKSATALVRGFVEVDLKGAYERMTAVAGVLDDATEPFQVGHFRVCLDGSPQPELKVAPGKPVTVELSVIGVLKLRLELYRPGVAASRARVTGARAGRLPELAWGNPTLS